jgi:DNA-binding HxlR family transcriptional regulator
MNSEALSPLEILIVAEIVAGSHRFEEIQSIVGISRNILTDRLESLIQKNVVVKVPYRLKPKKYEYHLADGGSLQPAFVKV